MTPAPSVNRSTDVEEFRDIPGFVGLYQVSNRGRVRSQTRILKCGIHRSGHRYCVLSKDSQYFNVQVHRLVLLTFRGPCPEGMQARHLDGDPTNNSPDNLAWGTLQENMRDQAKHGVLAVGERNGNSKLTRKEITEIRAAARARGLAEKYRVNRSTIHRIRTMETWL